MTFYDNFQGACRPDSGLQALDCDNNKPPAMPNPDSEPFPRLGRVQICCSLQLKCTYRNEQVKCIGTSNHQSIAWLRIDPLCLENLTDSSIYLMIS